KSPDMRRAIQARYGSAPTDEGAQAWKDRHKWRREVDLSGARLKLFIDTTRPTQLLYLQTIMLNLQIIYAQDSAAN
ncbi:membrane protein, partial [Pseudomonas syringae pv. actinidiae ICMP 19073]|uniref:hypothetical protein n=1 Tax=Pseudomonas syringae TaxID=317 RepID=UPI000357D417